MRYVLFLILTTVIGTLKPMIKMSKTTGKLTPSHFVTTNAAPQFVSCSSLNNLATLVATDDNTVQTFKTVDHWRHLSSAISTQSTELTPKAVAWAPSGKFLAVVNWGADTMQIFSVNTAGRITGQVGRQFVGSGPIAVAFSPSGKYIAVMNFYGYCVQIFSMNNRGTVSDQIGFQNIYPDTQGTSIAFSPNWSAHNGGLLAVSSMQAIQIFKLSPHGNLSAASAQHIGATHVSWAPNGKAIVASGATGGIRTYRIDSRGILSGFINSQDTATTVSSGAAWSPLGNVVAVISGSSSQVIQLFPVNLQGRLSPASQSLDTRTGILSLAWTPAGNVLLATTIDNKLKTFNYR